MTPEFRTHVLAAIDDSPAAAPVLTAATTIATLLDAELEAIHVHEAGKHTARAVAEHAGVDLLIVDGDPVTEIGSAAADPAVALVVVGTRAHPAGARPAGHITCSTLEQLDKPVLVVPPESVPPGAHPAIRRALFPLEGTEQSSGAVTDILHRLATAGVELVGVHVFAAAVPAFWDQPAHAQQSWADQFVTKWCAETGIDLHLRRGSPAGSIVAVAEQQEVDLIAIGWSQDMSPGRAEVVQAVLTAAHVPVLLLPVPPNAADRGLRAARRRGGRAPSRDPGMTTQPRQRTNRCRWAGVVAFMLVGIGCGGDDAPETTTPGLPNPASVHCEDQGGQVEIVDEPDGQVGYCLLPDGRRIEEWELFRSEGGTTTDP